MGVRIKKTPPAGRKRGCWLKGFVLLAPVALIFLAGCDEPKTPPRQLAPTVTVQPQEDEPGFDCRVHGNRRCGEGTD